MVEKGSFQTSVKSVLEIDDFVENLPLPNQMPAPTPSRTVEHVLSQNADLMARLSVSLRNSSHLEMRVTELEKENMHVKHRYDAVKDQLLVVQEKERLVTERSRAAGTDIEMIKERHKVESSALRERIALLERTYADVYARAQNLERYLGRLRQYRARVKQAIQNLKGNVADLAGHRNPILAVEEARVDITRVEQEQIQMAADHSAAQVEMINRYESELNGIRAEIELLRRRAADRDLLYESKVRLENQLIFEQRQSQHYREDTQRELQSTKEENSDLKDQLKTRLIEMERYEREILVSREKLASLETDNKEQLDQVESLQLLWREKQAEIERLEEKNRSLQKLNQQLSVTINTQRKDLIEAKSEAERVRFSSEEKVKAFELQLNK